MKHFNLNIKTSIGLDVIIWLCLISIYPFVFSQFIPIPSVSITTIIIIVIISAIIASKKNLFSFPKLFNQIIVGQIIGWCIFYFFHRDSTYFTRIIFILTSYEILLLIYNNKGGFKHFIKSYNYLIILMAIGGVIAFFLVLFFNFSPLLEYNNVDGRSAYFYGFTCTNARIGNIIRYAGFFDEPGAMAFWGIYAIVFNELFIKNKIISKYLPILLLFTFSLAFFIQYFVYYICFKIQSTKQILLIVAYIGICFGCIKLMENTDFALVYDFTIGRMQYDKSSGTIAGNNRSDLSENAKIVFLESPLIGNGPQIIKEVNGMADNPYENLATDGIIGTVIMYLPLIVLFFGYKNRKLKFAIIILTLGYLQRPFHPNLLHPFVLYLFTIQVIINQNKADERIQKNICDHGYVQC